MLGTCLENVRNTVPLVHNITNYVTVNDVANILLACGGSPIMSDEPEDVEDITSICGGLNINIGTLNQRSIEGMFRAGAKANALGHVVLLDPVGAGASALRTNTAVELMEKIKFTVIRGNISEIKTLALGVGTCILKDGENGSWLIGRDGGPQHIAPWPVEAVDTTGCGDSYCGGFIAALARGLSVKAACDVASAVAALVATGMGSDAGVVDWEQTQAFMAAHRP